MIRHIMLKELLVNLLSLRFAVGLIVVALMMGVVGYILTEDYAARRQTYLSDVQRHQESLKQTKVFSMIEVVVDIPPSPLSVFSRGVKDLPTAIRVSPYQIPSLISEEGTSSSVDLWGTSNRPYNPLLRVFAPIDLAYVISMILSLFAILLVFDSFSGEREQGTLKLILSGPVGRIQLLIGKFLGALLTMAVPLTVGFLEVMLLWSISPSVSLDAASWAGIGLIYFVSLIFLAGVIALGLFVSLFATESSSGFVYLLLAWVAVAIVIPEGGGYLAEYARPRESLQEIVAGVKQEFWKVEYRQKSGWWGASTGGQGETILGVTEEEAHNRVEHNKKTFPMKFQYAEDRYRVLGHYTARLRQWGQLRDNLVRPSFCVLYRNVVQAVSGTDINSYDAALRHTRTYREALMGYLRPKVATPQWVTRVLEYPDMQPTEENQRYWKKLEEQEGGDVVSRKILNWGRVAPLDLSTMPLPNIAFPGLAERVGGVTLDVLLLVGITGLFIGLAIRRVLNYMP